VSVARLRTRVRALQLRVGTSRSRSRRFDWREWPRGKSCTALWPRRYRCAAARTRPMSSLKGNSRSAYARDASADVARIRAHVAPGLDVRVDVLVKLARWPRSRALVL
jgi:hypothetical protein